MGAQSRPFNDKTAGAIDRKRERERKGMLQYLYRNSEELATKLSQRLLDRHIVETNSVDVLRELFSSVFQKLSEMEDFDIQYKISPLRGLVNDANFVSLYLTQYVIEDLVNHEKVQEVYGDDTEIYQAVDSILRVIKPPEN